MAQAHLERRESCWWERSICGWVEKVNFALNYDNDDGVNGLCTCVTLLRPASGDAGFTGHAILTVLL